MTDVRELMSGAYTAIDTGGEPDEAVVTRLVAAARGRRRGRIALSSLSAVAVVASVTFGALALSGSLSEPVVTPSPTGPAPTAPADAGITYVDSMPGVNGVTDTSVLTGATASGRSGVPDLYPMSQAVLDQAGPGWRYVVYSQRDCADQLRGYAPILALVSPDGYSFLAAKLPEDQCAFRIVDQSAEYVFIEWGDSDTQEHIEQVNVLTGVRQEVANYGDGQVLFEMLSGRNGMVVTTLPESSPLINVFEGDTYPTAVMVPYDEKAKEYSWGEADGELLFAVRRATGQSIWDQRWYAFAVGDDTVREVTLSFPDGKPTASDCGSLAQDGRFLVLCDVDANGNPGSVYEVHADGTVQAADYSQPRQWAAEATHDDFAGGHPRQLNAAVTVDFGDGPVPVLDSSVLDPAADQPWRSAPRTDAYAQTVVGDVLGVTADVTTPDDASLGVVALARPGATWVIQPEYIDGEPTDVGAWAWWSAS